MYWDRQYREKRHLWGSEPNELAKIASRYFGEHMPNQQLNILDVGCGYGRDAIFLSGNHNFIVRGIDVSSEALAIASEAVPESQKKRVKFWQSDFRELDERRYDVVFSSNLYQLLREHERREFVKAVLRSLKPSGLLFLSTLSASDPEHRGKGIRIADEPNSFQDVVYLHLCTRDELQSDFVALDIRKLFEHEFQEPRANGETHHHISWILIGEYSQ